MTIPRNLLDEIDARDSESFDAIARTIAGHTRRPSGADQIDRRRANSMSPSELLEEFGGLQ